ncbi:tetratricopeptide repeat protein [Bartonella sp. B17]
MHIIQTVLENNDLEDIKKQFTRLFGQRDFAFYVCPFNKSYWDKSFQVVKNAGTSSSKDNNQSHIASVEHHDHERGVKEKSDHLGQVHNLLEKVHDEKSNYVEHNRNEGLSVLSSKELYKKGYDFILSANYLQAEKVFCAFQNRYKEDPLSIDALFWLAEALLRQGRYYEAAQTYLTLWYTDKRNFYDSEILLKLAISMAALEKNKENCALFEHKQNNSQTLEGIFCRHL